ncbi:hypothetical protein MKL26_07020 [Streptococcus suis]|nr:hypothetical protein [Streptococcus suis]
MIYKFWIDADYFDNIDAVILDDSNIADIQYKSFRKGWFKLAFESGNDIDLSLLPDIKFYYDSLKGNIFSEVLINAFGVVIVSNCIKETFIEEGILGIQYIPITIEDRSGSRVCDDYYIINFLDIIDSINLDLSTYDYLEEYNMYTFFGNSICFNKKSIEGHDIFKDVKAIKSIFVSETVKNVFIKMGWKGINFTPLMVTKN